MNEKAPRLFPICWRILMFFGLFFWMSELQKSPAQQRIQAFSVSKVEIQVGQSTRSYLVHLPPAFQKGNSMALVLAFHGGGGSARIMANLTRLNALASQRGFLVIYPESVGGNWNDGRETAREKLGDVDDIGFVRALIARAARDYPIDRKRVYATGISNGGMFSLRLACELADTIAAVASVAATMPQSLCGECKPARPISVLIIHGTQDPLIPFEGGEIRKTRQRGLGGKVLGTNASIGFWMSVNETSLLPATTLWPDRDTTDGTRVIGKIYGQGRDQTEVAFYEIINGGHTWPGALSWLPESLVGKTSHDIDASEVIWDFFARHPMRS